MSQKISKSAIVTHLKKKYPILQNKPNDEIENMLFRRSFSFQLTYKGYALLSSIIKSYSFPCQPVYTGKQLMGLSMFESPFYLTKDVFVIFSQEDAAMLQLYNGDVLKFLELTETYRN